MSLFFAAFYNVFLVVSGGRVSHLFFDRYQTPVAFWDSVVNSVVYCGGSTHLETFSVLHNAYWAFGRTIFVAYYKMHTISMSIRIQPWIGLCEVCFRGCYGYRSCAFQRFIRFLINRCLINTSFTASSVVITILWIDCMGSPTSLPLGLPITGSNIKGCLIFVRILIYFLIFKLYLNHEVRSQSPTVGYLSVQLILHATRPITDRVGRVLAWPKWDS